MTCLPCFEGFLDSAPATVRLSLHQALEDIQSLPVDDIQAQLDVFSTNLNVIDARVNAELAKITVADDAINQMELEIINQGVNVSTCPQISVALSQMRLHSSLLSKHFKDPFTKRRNLLRSEIARFSGIISQANALQSAAAGLVC